MKLKLQFFGHLMRRVDSLEETLMLGKIEGGRRGQQRMRQLDGITDSMDMSLSKLQVGDGQGGLACCSPWDSQESSPTSQFKSINSSAFSFLYGPALTSIHDYWRNHSFDQTDLCWQNNVSAFQCASRLVFSMGMVLIPVSCTMSQTSIHSSSVTLSIRSSPLNLFLISTV